MLGQVLGPQDLYVQRIAHHRKYADTYVYLEWNSKPRHQNSSGQDQRLQINLLNLTE